MLSDFFSASTSIWSPPKHTLVADNPDSEVVYGNPVRLLAHDLGCHVARSAGGIFRVVWVPDTGDTEVGDLEVAFLIEYKIFRFDITM